MKKLMMLLLAICCVALSVSAEEKKDLKTRLDDEFKWLREEAMTVTVATKTKMNIEDAPSIVSVITAEEIKNSGAKNFEEVLRQVAGFYAYRDTTYPDLNMSIRGLGNAANPNVKIMINGHSVENPLNQNIGWFTSFPVDLIKKIEIIRGPGSALYGNAAMNGVINIITKDAGDPSALSASYGSFDTYRGTGQLSYAKNDFSLFFFADNIRSSGDPQMIESDYASLSFPQGYSFAPGYSNEDFRYSNFFTELSYRNFRLTGFFKDSRGESPVGLQNALSDENTALAQTAFIEASYDSMLTSNMRLSARTYYDYFSEDIRNEVYDQKTTVLLGFPEGQGIIANPEGKTKKMGAEVMMTISLPNHAEIVSGVLVEYIRGYDFKEYTNVNPLYTPIVLNGMTYMPMEYLGGIRDLSDSYNWMDEDKARRTIYAGYIQGTWNISEAFPVMKHIGKLMTLTAGLRYDEYDDVGGSSEPRIGIVYAPNDRLFFKVLYGEAFRAPGFDEMYFINNPVAVGNPNLKPEKIRTAEIQAGIRLTEQITATLDFFNVRKKDAIGYYQGIYSNWGEIESSGVEGEIRASFGKSRYAYFNMTFQKAKDVTDETLAGTAYLQEDFDLGNYPEVMANFGADCEIGKHINANVWVNYIGSIDRIGKMRLSSEGTIEKADSREPIDSYALTNVSLIFRNFGFAKGWEFQITGYNIFNADHRDPEPEGMVRYDLPRWGRHFLGKITYTF